MALSLFLLSCINTTSEKKETMISEAETHQHESPIETLVLNNGQKWKVDDNMMIYIQNMEADITSFTSNSQKEYQMLADKLQKNVNLLTSNCTMSGMAHDELHKWLVPYIKELNALSESETEAEAGKAFVSLQESFITFNQYFK
jgi:hypothetical protein